MNPRVSDRNHPGCDLEFPLYFNNNMVSWAGPCDGDKRSSFGLPLESFRLFEEYRLIVKGKCKTVLGIIPCGSLLGANEEAMAVKQDSHGLDPGEVPSHVFISLANEVCIDVKVRVCHEAKVSVLLTMEVECDTVFSYEARVLAYCTRIITTAYRFASRTIHCT